MPRSVYRQLLGLLCSFLVSSAALAPVYAEEAWEFSERINKGTVSVISGGINGTYIRIATDLASVLDNGDDLRVLAIMGKGSEQNIDDILYLKGIDIGIVQSDVFAHILRTKKHPTIDQRIHYVTKLYNEELHLLAHGSITGIGDLAGKPVNFGVQGSGTYMTASILFDTLGIAVEPVAYDQALALEKVRSGEIAALVYVAGKPTQLFKEVQAGENLQLLEIPLTSEVLETYLPSRFSHDDYPALVPAGQQIKTLAVGAVMAVYNWDKGTNRYEKVARFVDRFFSNFEEFQKPPRHRKWQEVSLTAQVPGWTRFGPAEEWLARSAVASTEDSKEFEAFLSAQAKLGSGVDITDQEKEALFKQFLLWQASQQQ